MDLKENELVEDWLLNVKDSTARKYRYLLGYFLEYSGLTPEQLIKESTVKLRTLLNKYYKHLRDEGKTRSYAALNEAAVKSFLSYYEVKVKTRSRKKPRKYHRKIMRREDIKKLVEAAPYLRDKAMILLVFQSGMAISDLLALDYGQVRKAIENNISPYSIRYIREKSETEGIAIIGQDSITLLKKYTDWRKEQNHVLTDVTPLFTRVREGDSQKRLTKRSAQFILRETMVKAGLITYQELKQYKTFNPYGYHAIRKAFSSIAELAGMPKSQIEMSLGHTLDYNGAYTEFTPEEMIDNFKKCENALSIYAYERELEDKTKALEDKVKTYESKLAHYADLEAKVNAMAEYIEQKVKEEKSNAK